MTYSQSTLNASPRRQPEQPSGPAAIGISVVIPTYNRSDALLLCLEHLERQSCPDFEVIVVDDGSTDGTAPRLETYLKTTPLRIRYVRQENSGPARARNVAIRLVESPLCLMIGDDILVSPNFVRTHLQFHQSHPDHQVAALGLTRWSEAGQTVTPFMRWLDESGTQFSYRDLLAGVPPCWKHFYTSNLSLKTELLRQNLFNEAFVKATMEDIELGYRLQVQHGLKIAFLPEALGWHLHPTGFVQACRRLEAVGRSIHLFHELWPDQRPAPRGRVRQSLARVLYENRWIFPPLRRLTALVTRFWCPNPLLRRVLALHTGLGYRTAASTVPIADVGKGATSQVV